MDRAHPGLKASVAKLYADLQRVAVRNVVPEHVFRKATEALGLGEAERLRLAKELARLKLYIGEPVRSAEADSQDPGKVALSRVAIARRLLERFSDGEGRVAGRAMEGVVRLAGLSEREAAELRAAAPTPPSSDGSVGASDEQRAGPATEEPHLSALAAGDVEEAVAAALAVLADDRFVGRPGKRILTAAQEVGLSLLLRGGAERVGEEPTDEELAGLPPTDVRRQARDCLVVHNQGLVHSLARQLPEQGLGYDDLFQHGVLGLIRAARKFDPRRGNKFSTYATWWIRQSISRAIADEGSLIRIPVHMHELVQKVARTERALLSQGRSPRAAEVAVACDLSVEKVEQIRRISLRTDSLDRVIGDGTHLGDIIEARTAIPGVERTVLAALDEAEMLNTVELLPERYAHIVTRRFGLDGTDPATLDEISRDLSVTRERVRQLEAHVLPLLRLAYTDSAGGPYTALRLMLSDTWRGSAPANPVSAIANDLARKNWKTAVGALCEFRKRHRRSFPAPDHKEGTFPLGRWVAEQRRSGGINGDGLPTHRRIVLESLGMVWQGEPEARPSPRRRRPRRTVRTPQSRPHAAAQRPPAPFADRPAERPASSSPGPSRHEPAPVPAAAGVPVPGDAGTPTPDQQNTDWEAPAPSLDADHGTTAAQATREAVRECEEVTHSHRTASWAQVTRSSPPWDRNVRWMAEYALQALGSKLLFTILGGLEAAAVARAAASRRLLDLPVVLALDSLTRVLDTLGETGMTPGEFFASGSPTLQGDSPSEYLTRCPLVHPEARTALWEALGVYLGNAKDRRIPVTAGATVQESVAATDVLVRGEHEAAARITNSVRRLAELRQALAAPVRVPRPVAAQPPAEPDPRLWWRGR